MFGFGALFMALRIGRSVRRAGRTPPPPSVTGYHDPKYNPYRYPDHTAKSQQAVFLGLVSITIVTALFILLGVWLSKQGIQTNVGG